MTKLDPDEWEQLDKRKFLVFGVAATVSIDFITYPLDLVKTRVMTEANNKATMLESNVRAFRGVLATSGVKGLWRGFPLSSFGALPSQGVYFGGYSYSHSLIAASNTGLPLWTQDAAAGFIADIIAAPFWTPTEVVATRMQIQGKGVQQYTSAAQAFQHILKHEGVRGLFRGLSVSLAYGPASALWWALYQGSHRNLTAWSASGDAHSDTKKEGKAWIDATSGLISGTVTSVMTNPLDIAKTRLQTQHCLLAEYEVPSAQSSKPVLSSPVPPPVPAGALSFGGAVEAGAAQAVPRASVRPVLHNGLISVLLSIVRTDGPRALVRGLLPRLITQGPASAATFMAYEQVKRLSRKEPRGLE